MAELPNPGSDAARALGCLCPVLDNNHGRWLPWQGGWIISARCPMHGPPGWLKETPEGLDISDRD